MHRIDVRLLAECSEIIPQLSSLWYREFASIWLPNADFYSEEEPDCHLNVETLPLTFVALFEDQPIGLCSLRMNDGIRSELSPWLGSLVVASAYQGKGVGRLLIETTIDKSRAFGFEKLYLFILDTSLEPYYAKMGWKTIGTDQYANQSVIVMCLDLN